MKIDLSKNGFDSIFTPWQIATLQLLDNKQLQEAIYPDGWTSAALHSELCGVLMEDSVSRASVINFMKEIEAWSIIGVEKGHKQGGEYSIYTMRFDLPSLWTYIKTLTGAWMRESDRILSSTKTVKTEVEK